MQRRTNSIDLIKFNCKHIQFQSIETFGSGVFSLLLLLNSDHQSTLN